jgi:hypothetical protein
MSIHDAAIRFIDAANDLGIEHLLVGSLAASFHGLMRSTTDADFVVQLGTHGLNELVARLGGGFQLEPQAAFEIHTLKKLHVINVVGTIFKIDVFQLSSDPFDQERFRRRIKVDFLGRQVCVPTAEDVVVMKVRWHRPYDLEDAKAVIAAGSDRLDWPYIRGWCDLHGTRHILDDLEAQTPRL